ncbi:hypothetical protein GCM10007147_11270 [Nocardiopsis kunsanensis]|uniref:Cas12f1-like TNB domain-containing protein n=1 Tax=Nocardiopsis kunsanensis TaxID=141693 RepID=A0A919CGH8_9ACTN|nr:transposase [Nocardiopsis kunsanensis]GHD19903.1 hypothetical protein GCM10007147_11270 [Nocardiopsis kunsanensis]
MELGIAHSATTSTGYRAAGRGLNRHRKRQLALRARTTACGRGLFPTPQRVALHSWALAQLAGFLVYKAERAGVPVVFVDPAYTSQTCAACDHVGKRNRVGQGLFICRGCGVVVHADRNASRNLATRGQSVWNAGRESRAPATP